MSGTMSKIPTKTLMHAALCRMMRPRPKAIVPSSAR